MTLSASATKLANAVYTVNRPSSTGWHWVPETSPTASRSPRIVAPYHYAPSRRNRIVRSAMSGLKRTAALAGAVGSTAVYAPQSWVPRPSRWDAWWAPDKHARAVSAVTVKGMTAMLASALTLFLAGKIKKRAYDAIQRRVVQMASLPFGSPKHAQLAREINALQFRHNIAPSPRRRAP